MFLFLLMCVSSHGITQTLDLTYDTLYDWNYCEIHEEECDKIANFDDSILPQFDMTPSITNAQWRTFVTLQVLDMYTTYKGLQYDCVYEANPIFGERPSVMKMGVTKFVILYPVMQVEMQENLLSREDLRDVNFLMGLVVANNMQVLTDSKRKCNKIR
ncbi:hypothetical protein N9I83_01740 [bacterium]|nr:hypothetical protein [bacterium]